MRRTLLTSLFLSACGLGWAAAAPPLPAEFSDQEKPPQRDRYGQVEIDRVGPEGLEVADHVFAEWAPPLIDASYLQDQPPPATQPTTPLPMVTQPPAGLTGGLGLGGIADRSALTQERQVLAASGASSVTSGDEAQIRNTTDAADLLGSSATTPGVVTQARNPIITDLRIRGYRYAQIRGHANGAFYTPARPDLDTALSKIDSSLIRDVVTIMGPYSVRHGPGFAFVDVDLESTPRYCNGACWGGRTLMTYDTNGEAWYGRQTVWGGNANYGYRLGYGHRTAVDYEAGDGRLVASGYLSRDVDFAFGIDLSPDSSIEFNYLRLGLQRVELPGQFNDIVFSGTDSYSLRYTLENQAAFDRLAVDYWYNRNRFSGTPQFKQETDAFFTTFIAVTSGDITSTGYRAAMTWGQADDAQLTFGSDLTYLDQEFIEDNLPPDGVGDFGIPRTHSSNPGVFVDGTVPFGRLTLKAGGRADWVSVGQEQSDLFGIVAPIDNDYQLWASYITAQYELNDVWTGMVGIGAAQRAPTATDLYGVGGPFLGIVQQGGLFFPVGNPNLDPERLKQIDVGLDFNYSNVRGYAHAYHAWVDDFITYSGIATVNRDATLAGFEAYSEADMSQRLQLFGALFYTEGRDRVINTPLWGVPPLESRLGVRLHDVDNRWWGLEFSARIVENQDRFASVPPLTNPVDPNGVGELATPGFTTYDIRGFYRLNDIWTFTAGVENLTDKFYQEHLDSRIDMSKDQPDGVFRPGRNFYFGFEALY